MKLASPLILLILFACLHMGSVYVVKLDEKGGTYTLHMKNGNIQLMSGFFADINNVNTSPSLPESAALGAAISYVGASRYEWQEAAPAGQMPAQMPQGELVILPDADSRVPARLAWKFDIYAMEPLYRAYVFVDAQTGTVITEHARIHHANVPATGTSLYNGTVSFTADQTGTNAYRLRQTASGSGVETYTLNNGTNYNNAADITSTSSNDQRRCAVAITAAMLRSVMPG